MKKLWYVAPASIFEEALPIGNGRLGGMHYAGVSTDKISLNEDTLWSGFPRDKSARAPYESVCAARALMSEGKIADAERILRDGALGDWTEAYQPAGNIKISLVGGNKYSDYTRELNISDAIARSSFKIDGYFYEKELFCSAPDKVMIYRFHTDAPSSNLEIALDSPHPYKISFENGIYIMRSIAPYYSAPNYFKCDDPIRYDSFEGNRALSYCAGFKIILSNGNASFNNGTMSVSSTDFYIVIDVETNFAGWKVQPKDSLIDPVAICAEKINAASQLSFAELRDRHVGDYRSLFDRLSLFIEGNNRDDLPTDERIAAYSEDNSDVGLPVLLYDFSRYITISSSREGSQATNLQGIWNEHLRAPWSSNYTLNINAQMNYWHVERANLSECHLPLMSFISELSERGEKTARDYYGTRGWCAHHNSDLWRQTDPVGREAQGGNPIQYGFWNMGGCWLACHIWEHYQYTNDIEFLKNSYTALKEAALFLLDWLDTDENGRLITPLSTSPENRYKMGGVPYALSAGCAMDQSIAAELFSACISAANELDVDRELADTLTDALSNLAPLRVGKDGELLEWNAQLDELDPRHRHISLLFGLYPGHTINSSTPELAQASRNILIRRGLESTGWGLAWRICTWSRLGDAENAKKFVDSALRLCLSNGIRYDGGGGIYPNMLSACPPFQIDATYGFAAGINEMLLQEENGKPIPLPALPIEWQKGGYVKGMKLHGNRTADIAWKDGKITEFNVQ